MKFDVYLTAAAEDDIFDIYQYVYFNDSPDNANLVFSRLQETCTTLRDFPERGHVPPELERINIRDYKEIHYKPYRIIYTIVETKVFIHCFFDGRRDLQDILEKRILR
jgi:toxin ParE1/3/4